MSVTINERVYVTQRDKNITKMTVDMVVKHIEPNCQ